MPHIFISYSRKDIDYAAKIVHALADSNLETWIDWKSIPKGEDWEQEIYQGIEEADAFLFLISPDSVTSQMCNKEIAHAAKNGKRILPIVVRDTESTLIHPEISKRNWVLCRDGRDDFHKAIQGTQEAIHTDYGWLRFHTKLQLRALDWQRRNDSSRLLRGRELEEAEQLLVEVHESTNPQPIRLQREFVQASKKSEEQRRRQFTTRLISVFCLVLSIAIIAILQWQRAEASRLAATARALLAENRPELAALVALKSLQVWETREAQDILDQIPPRLDTFRDNDIYMGNPGFVSSYVAWSADGKLASGGAVDPRAIGQRESLILWDQQKLGPKQYLYLDDPSELVTSVEWSVHGQLAAGTTNGNIYIWDFRTGEQPIVLGEHSKYDQITVAWLSEKLLASAGSNGKITIWDLQLQASIDEIEVQSPVFALDWSADGLLAAGLYDGTILIWDMQNDTFIHTLDAHSGGIYDLSWSADGQLASASADGAVTVWSISDTSAYHVLHGHSSAVRSVDWSPTGQLASSSDDGTVILWDLINQVPEQILRDSSSGSIAWSPDGQLASALNDFTMIVWDLESTRRPHVLKSRYAAVKQLKWAPNGLLASAGVGDTILIWNLESDSPQYQLEGHAAEVRALAWSTDGKFASGSDDGDVIVWDLVSGKPLITLRGEHGGIFSLDWSSSGKLAAGTQDGNIIIWKTENWQVEHLVPVHTDAVLSLDWSKDGILASGSMDGTAAIINVENGNIHRLWHNDQYWPAINEVSWSEDNKLATASEDLAIVIWDGVTGKPEKILEDLSSVRSISWASDGRLASGLRTEKVRIWNVETGEIEQTIHFPHAGILTVTWSQHGYLAIGLDSGGAIVIIPKELAASPCQWLGRNLTPTEWIEYVGVQFAYTSVCPNKPIEQLENPSITDIAVGLIALEVGGNFALITRYGRMVILGVITAILVILSLIGWGSLYLVKITIRRFRSRN